MKIDFGAACKDLFSTEGKWMTILGIFVCFLIPIVGPIVGMGYLIRRFVRVRSGYPKEDFDFQNFSEYLKIGLWPFLCTLVATLVFIPLVFIAMLPMVLGPIIDPENQVLIAIFMLVGALLYMVVFFVMMLVMYPIMLQSGMTMDFKKGFGKKFIVDFIKKVGLSMVLWMMLVSIIAVPLTFVGYLALFIGVYVVAVWSQMVMMNLLFQHYDLYLHRGGEPVEINPEVIKDYGNPPVPQIPSPPMTPDAPE